MDGKKRDFHKKRSNSHFKKKGFNNNDNNNNKRLKSSSDHERPSREDDTADTVYRILCPSKKIGGVIGKGGGIIKALREETKAKITVADSVSGSDERVIIIYSSGAKISKKQTSDEEEPGGENKEGDLEPHCAAQDALLKVHDRIVEEDLFGGMTFDDESDSNTVTIRLLVPNNTVGCILGKGGDVIQRLRSETGAGIRVLPSEHLPTCAMRTDELVQITGKSNVAKRALYEVSTLLHKNPRKDQPPSNFSAPHDGQSFHRGGDHSPNMLPHGNPMWSHRDSDPYGIPPAPWMGEYGTPPRRFEPGDYESIAPGHVREVSAEFSMKILCSGAKIGGVIGKGGYHVKQLQQETGASIHVEDASEKYDERIIHVSAVEDPWNPRSQTIDAILLLQSKTSEFSEKGTITTRLLVPSTKVGCILGQGGYVINEMRKRTQADIRVISKDEKPKCASNDEELVQISGIVAVARDALAEISSRLRARILRDANAGSRPAPTAMPVGFLSERRLPPGRPPPFGAVGAGSSGIYDRYKGRVQDFEPHGYPDRQVAGSFLPPNSSARAAAHEYEPHGYPGQRAAARYPGSDFEARIANSSAGRRRGSFSSHGEISGGRLEYPDHQPVGSDTIAKTHGSAPQALYNPYETSTGPDTNAQQTSYHNASVAQGLYPGMIEQQEPYPVVNNTQRSPYSRQQGLYSDINIPPQVAAFQGINAQHGSYQY